MLISIRKVLKPGGRIAAEMGGFMNCVGLCFVDTPCLDIFTSNTGVRAALHDVVKSKGHDPKEIDPWYGSLYYGELPNYFSYNQ